MPAKLLPSLLSPIPFVFPCQALALLGATFLQCGEFTVNIHDCGQVAQLHFLYAAVCGYDALLSVRNTSRIVIHATALKLDSKTLQSKMEPGVPVGSTSHPTCRMAQECHDPAGANQWLPQGMEGTQAIQGARLQRVMHYNLQDPVTCAAAVLVQHIQMSDVQL